MNPMDLKRGIDKAISAAVEEVKKLSTPCKDSSAIAQVGSISANGDTAVGEIIDEAMDKVGRDGVITVEESKTRDTTLPDMPENVITEIFNLEIGKGSVVSGDQKSYILRLKNMSEADLSTDKAKLLISQIKNQINNSLSADLFESFANMARINSKLDINEQALNAVHSSFQ